MFSEVQRMTNSFERILGKEGFGIVFHGYLDDTQVTIKMLSHSSVQGYRQFQAEVSEPNMYENFLTYMISIKIQFLSYRSNFFLEFIIET